MKHFSDEDFYLLDKLLFDYDCPFYEKLLAEQYESASESLSEGGFLDQLTNYTGSPVESFDDIISLHAILHAQVFISLSLPEPVVNLKGFVFPAKSIQVA